MSLLITDPTLLLLGNSDAATTPGAEMVVDVSAKTIQIIPGQGDLDATVGGATGQALYSALKILWRNSSTYIKYPFPMESITPEQFEFINGWAPADDTTRKAIRTAGWVEKDAAGNVNRTYAGVISLGSMGAADQPYYQQSSNGASANFEFTGPVNEAVQIFGTTANGDTGAGDFNYASYMKLFAREYQKVYASASLGDIGVTAMTSIVYRFPLANSTDLKITHDDTTIEGVGGNYENIDITYYATDQVREIGTGNDYNFRVIVDGNNKTAEQIYEKVQYLLRQNSDIDTGGGTVTGKTADSLLRFVGDTLVTSQGVYIDNFNANDTNRIEFYDYTSNLKRTFPFVAAGTIQLGANAVSDASAKYWLFFETLPGAANDFGESGAVIVNDASGTPITGSVSGQSSIAFTFAYDSNVQGGRTAATEASVRLVVSGLTKSQYTSSLATITRSTGQSIAAVPALERNYVQD